eukprot:TRINITY_DN50802_c0_g1_i1.p1 TRINITY_DN50802_c0_g1~~TRINITY_DN50802_c0_g1_i1.p1  ORF type:complete len:600 (+),score=68.96 TRINITY_DN50802_c0_g1_i1:82-1800(+)
MVRLFGGVVAIGVFFFAIQVRTIPDGQVVGMSNVEWVFCAPQGGQCDGCPGQVRWGFGSSWIELAPRKPDPVRCNIEDLGDPLPGEDLKRCECAVLRDSEFYRTLNPSVLAQSASLERADDLVASCEVFETRAGERLWSSISWDAVRDLCGEGIGKSRERRVRHGSSLLLMRSELGRSKTVRSDMGAGSVGNKNDAASLPLKITTEVIPAQFSRSGPRSLDDKTVRGLLRAWVDPRFSDNYASIYGGDGWAPQAFVNFVWNARAGSRYAKMTEQLIRSVHLFSSRPVIVVNFGMATPPEWDAKHFPRLVLLHATPIQGRSGNFNKYIAILLARVRTGVQLDSDQFVVPGVDALFHRTEEEVNAEYPIPILPVHFLPDKGPNLGGSWWPRFCNGNDCGKQTLRWGHAHPTWTYWALPFFGRWLKRHLRDEELSARPGDPRSAIRVSDVAEDEDLLNLGTWEEGGSKQWCKFDVPDPSEMDSFLESGTPSSKPCNPPHCRGDIESDSRFYPFGAPLVFYTAHHAVDPDSSKEYITKLLEAKESNRLPPPIRYAGRFFNTSQELLAVYPKLGCTI